ncbi:unnamed protein product [Agarophyton chilense]
MCRWHNAELLLQLWPPLLSAHQVSSGAQHPNIPTTTFVGICDCRIMRSDLLQNYGPCALVTGASSGIGAEFARQLAAHGFELVITARRKERLEQLSDALRSEYKVKVTIVELDLVEDGCVQRLVDATKHLEIGLLINNAGMAVTGAFMNMDVAECEKLIALNVWAVTSLARTFGRMMCERRKGGILFVSSLSSTGVPYMSVYSSSKAFVSCLGNVLKEELRVFDVEVMVLEPGFVSTEMTSEMKGNFELAKNLKMMAVDECVEDTLKAFGKHVFPSEDVLSSVPPELLILSGILVGAGTRIGNGCTSGHGICGLARLSKRSLVAVLAFMIVAITVASLNPFIHFPLQPAPPPLSASHLVVLATLALSIPPLLAMLEAQVALRFSLGVIFAAGLIISVMTWDPSLLFVFVGALPVAFAGFQPILNGIKPLFAEKHSFPTSTAIDKRLLLGSSLFGAGWGLIGMCPGPALVYGGRFPGMPALIYLISLIGGSFGARTVLNTLNIYVDVKNPFAANLLCRLHYIMLNRGCGVTRDHSSLDQTLNSSHVVELPMACNIDPGVDSPSAAMDRANVKSWRHNVFTSGTSQTPQSNNPLTSSLTLLASAQTSLAAASSSALLLSLAAALHVASFSTFLIRASLLGCFALTGLPALADSALRIIRSRGRTIDVNVLMSIAAAVCFFTGALFEGALLTTLYAVSHAAEDWMSGRARRELESLRNQAPSYALRVDSPTSSEPISIPVEKVIIGDFLLVKTGQVLPCDGQIVSGDAFVSMQHLTGEPVPRHVEVGDDIPAGSRTEDASIVVRVTKIGAESYLARIARLVTAAQENRPHVTKFFDRFGQIYARSVLTISFAIALILPLISSLFASVLPTIRYTGRSGSIARALGFLVVASPCALLIGAPIAYIAALSACARKGILAKSGAKSLEAASRATHVVFDKTGTLTTGKLTVNSAVKLPTEKRHANRTPGISATESNGVSTELDTLDALVELDGHKLSRVISAAAALERGAVHPIANALHSRAKQLGGPFPHVMETRTIAGQGVEGVLSLAAADDCDVAAFGRLGRPTYILPAHATAHRSIVEDATSRGEIVSILEIADDRYLLRMKDEVRPDARQLVQSLRQLGYGVSILTGDSAGAAKVVSDSVGGDVRVIANATPEDKVEYVRSLESILKEKNEGSLMVGDGVNDAAALASALVGVACGLSSTTAVHAADVVLVREELANVEWFMTKAKATEGIVKQNLAIALGLMVLSAVACVAGSIPLWLAVTLHEGGTLLVGINGLRLLRGQ